MDTQRRFAVMGENIYSILNRVMKNQRLLKLLKFTDSDPLKHPDLTQKEIDDMLDKNILIVPKIPDELDDKLCYLMILLDKYQVVCNNNTLDKLLDKLDIVLNIKDSVKYNVNINLLIDRLIIELGGQYESSRC